MTQEEYADMIRARAQTVVKALRDTESQPIECIEILATAVALILACHPNPAKAQALADDIGHKIPKSLASYLKRTAN